MKTAGSGRIVMSVAIGLVVCFVQPSHAGSDTPDSANKQDLLATVGRAGTAIPGEARQGGAIQLVASDQLNEVDRTVQEDTAAPTATAPNEAAQAPPPAAVAASSQHSVWDETSLIGKIFVGFGTFLTLASAARMFIG